MADTYIDPKTGKEMPKTKWVDPGFNRDLSSVTKPTAPAAPVKGSQADHHVTDNANHTKPVAPTRGIDAAESKLKKDVAAGKVKDVAKSKADIAKKTGAWPNGATN